MYKEVDNIIRKILYIHPFLFLLPFYKANSNKGFNCFIQITP